MTYVRFTSKPNNVMLPSCSGQCWLLDYLDPVKDFPTKDIIFLWYRPLLEDPKAFKRAVDEMANLVQAEGAQVLAALDSRGFFFAGAIAYKLGIPLILIRKPHKLPPPVSKIEYTLEYGSAAFELEDKAKINGKDVFIIDDIIATGGTIIAASKLLKQAGASSISACALIDLPALKGKELIIKKNVKVYSLASMEFH